MLSSGFVRQVTPQELRELRGGPPAARPLLLDVRESWERELARLDDDLHIPLADLPRRLDELPRGREIALYCHHGVRSLAAAQLCEAAGLSAMNLSGGIDLWSRKLDPRVPRY